MKKLSVVVVIIPFAAVAWDNLDYGVPGACDQIIEREGYALGYSKKHGQPLWVSYRLTANEATNRIVKYSGQFYYDTDIRLGTSHPKDYDQSDYVRGHLAPVADMRFSTNVMLQSFSMANVSPQRPGFNLGVWKRLEKVVRDVAVRAGSVFIVTGPVFLPDGASRTNHVNGIRVPDGFYKVVLVEKPRLRMAAYIVPNETTRRQPEEYAVSVDEVERNTGLDFFHTLSDTDQADLESKASALNLFR